MTELARKLLDELMGPDRNLLPSERASFRRISFTDADVCRYYMVDFCPHLQFLNTKSDIGPCPHRYHEESIREKFLREGQAYREAYERQFLDYLERLVGDLERRLRRQRERLDNSRLAGADPAFHSPECDALEERITLMELQIKDALKRIEFLAESGEIQEAQSLSLQVDAWRGEIERTKLTQSEQPAFRLEKRMEICETCGALLLTGETGKRLDAHFEGRQHSGWARLRKALEDYRRKYSTRHVPDRARRPPPQGTYYPRHPRY